MYVVVVISTCCRDNTHPQTNNKKSGAKKMRKTRSRCNSFACEGMNQPDSATGMHDCNRPHRDLSKKSDHVTRQGNHVFRTMKHNPSLHETHHESPTVGSNLESGEQMYGASCLRGENGRGVSRRFMIMRATSCGMLTMAVLPGLTLALSENV
jgi:hypothetical protein